MQLQRNTAHKHPIDVPERRNRPRQHFWGCVTAFIMATDANLHKLAFDWSSEHIVELEKSCGLYIVMVYMIVSVKLEYREIVHRISGPLIFKNSCCGSPPTRDEVPTSHGYQALLRIESWLAKLESQELMEGPSLTNGYNSTYRIKTNLIQFQK